MRVTLLSFIFLSTVMAISPDADAQRTRRRRGTTPSTTTPANGEGGSTDQGQTNDTRTPVNYSGIPIEVAPSEGYGDSSRRSLRPDGATDRSMINDRTPLAYEHLRWDDALYTERVWREIDVREKMNQTFRNKHPGEDGDQRFISILLRAVQSGEVTAFDGGDDRFTTPLGKDQQSSITAGGEPDTVDVRDLNDPDKVVKRVVTQKSFNPDDVRKFRIKEEWVFDREASRMFTRILGIAPLKTSFLPDGTERGQEVMFWVYYPDLRPVLAKYEVYNPKNMGSGRMTWEELFEARMFSSYITKSTLDNPFNRTLKQVYGKDGIGALLAGDEIKDKIFNYEQDLWSY